MHALTLLMTVLATAAVNVDAGYSALKPSREFRQPTFLKRAAPQCSSDEKVCGNFCIDIDDICCPNGNSCYSNEVCQETDAGEWGCCSVGDTCEVSSTETNSLLYAISGTAAVSVTGKPVPTTFSATSANTNVPTDTASAGSGSGAGAAGATSSSQGLANGIWTAGPIQTAAAVALAAFGLL